MISYGEDTLSAGRIILIFLMIIMFFTVVFSSLSYLIDVIGSLTDITDNIVRSTRPFMLLFSDFLVAIIKWLHRIFTDPLSLAVILVISFIYWLLTGE